jgi:hypothetical protein
LPILYHAHSEEQAKVGVIEIGFGAHSAMQKGLALRQNNMCVR